MERAGRALLLTALAGLLALSVWLANGAPLIYFDTGPYLEQGMKLLHLAGPPAPAAATGADPGAAGGSVNASRSPFYALLLASLTRIAGFDAIVVVNLALIALTTLLTARGLARSATAAHPAQGLAAAGIVAASLGALPFYVAFAMPDIFAPVMILAMAALASFWPVLSRPERAALAALALTGVAMHPSHLLAGAPLAALALLLAPRSGGSPRRRGGLAAGFLALSLLGVATAPALIGTLTESLLHKRVTFLPFLTARMIDDGPGRAELEARCPDPAFATCALQEALARGDDPTRFDAPNILFSTLPGRGSLALLPRETREEIAAEQVTFLRDTLRHHPLAVAGAVLRNTAEQLVKVSAEMTVPDADVLAAAHALSPALPASVDRGRLSAAGRGWENPLYALHGALYLLALALLARLAHQRRLAPADQALVLIVLAGIVLNALVCGAISEPAHRYGARVMPLLPMLAAMLTLARPRPSAAPGPL